jgi:hypothetical protein
MYKRNKDDPVQRSEKYQLLRGIFRRGGSLKMSKEQMEW